MMPRSNGDHGLAVGLEELADCRTDEEIAALRRRQALQLAAGCLTDGTWTRCELDGEPILLADALAMLSSRELSRVLIKLRDGRIVRPFERIAD